MTAHGRVRPSNRIGELDVAMLVQPGLETLSAKRGRLQLEERRETETSDIPCRSQAALTKNIAKPACETGAQDQTQSILASNLRRRLGYARGGVRGRLGRSAESNS